MRCPRVDALICEAIILSKCARTIRLSGEPYIDFEAVRFRGWTLSVAVITAFASGYFVVNTAPKLLCALPANMTTPDASRWVYVGVTDCK